MKTMHELVAAIVAAQAGCAPLEPASLKELTRAAYDALRAVREEEQAQAAALAGSLAASGDAVDALLCEVADEVAGLNIDKVCAAWPAEQRKLAELAALAPGSRVIEIGCFMGATTVWLAAMCRRLGKQLIAIDPWDGVQDGSDERVHEIFRRNTAAYGDVVHVIRAKSGDALPLLPADCAATCGLTFVDGMHTYPHVLYDLRDYWRALMPGGIMVVHDVFEATYHKGINRALAEFRPMGEVNYLRYGPGQEEMRQYRHGPCGLAWFRKE
ncbi:MAG: class I SAM-dependent methyltransferase [Desulfovibrionaceae bacterium]